MNRCRITALWLTLPLVPTAAVQGQVGGVESLRQGAKAFAAVAYKASSSVVFIQVECVREGATAAPFVSPSGEVFAFGEDLFRRFFGNDPPQLPQNGRAVSKGTGFVFADEKGLFSDHSHMLTHRHVAAGAGRIRVTFHGRREFSAKVKGANPMCVIAVIEIGASGGPPLPQADWSRLEVGE